MTLEIHDTCTFDINPQSDIIKRFSNNETFAADVRFVIGVSPAESNKPFSETSHLPLDFSEYADAVVFFLSGRESNLDFHESRICLTPIENRNAVKIETVIRGSEDLRFEDGVVDTEALAIEMYTTLREWHDKALEINPSLETENWCQELKSALEAVEEAMKEAGIEIPT